MGIIRGDAQLTPAHEYSVTELQDIAKWLMIGIFCQTNNIFRTDKVDANIFNNMHGHTSPRNSFFVGVDPIGKREVVITRTLIYSVTDGFHVENIKQEEPEERRLFEFTKTAKDLDMFKPN